MIFWTFCRTVYVPIWTGMFEQRAERELFPNSDSQSSVDLAASRVESSAGHDEPLDLLRVAVRNSIRCTPGFRPSNRMTAGPLAQVGPLEAHRGIADQQLGLYTRPQVFD